MVFGSSTFAVSTVLAVFFLGLACGSFLFGRIGQRASRPLRLFAMIEIGLGLIASVSPYGFDLMDGLFGAVYRATAQEPSFSCSLVGFWSLWSFFPRRSSWADRFPFSAGSMS